MPEVYFKRYFMQTKVQVKSSMKIFKHENSLGVLYTPPIFSLKFFITIHHFFEMKFCWLCINKKATKLAHNLME